MDNPENIIIYGTGSDPDYHRLTLILAIKELAWAADTNHPAFLNGIRNLDHNIPILRHGNCFFSGSMVATLALEQLCPEPSLFPNGNAGMPLALNWWSDDFYWSVIKTKDEGVFRKNCALISRQLCDGRSYLQGSKPGLADINSFAPLLALKEAKFDISSALKKDVNLGKWAQRMEQIRAIDSNKNFRLNPTLDFPSCDDIADKAIFNAGKNIIWHRAPSPNK